MVISSHDRIIIPIIRNVLPNTTTESITSVQPMTDNAGSIFNLKVTHKKRRDRFGDYIHSFMDGWMVYDGKKFIPDWMFVQRYPDLNYEELANMKSGTTRWRITDNR